MDTDFLMIAGAAALAGLMVMVLAIAFRGHRHRSGRQI